MTNEATVKEIRELDELFVRAQRENDQKIWEEYHRKKKFFEKVHRMGPRKRIMDLPNNG